MRQTLNHLFNATFTEAASHNLNSATHERDFLETSDSAELMHMYGNATWSPFFIF